MGCEEKKTSTNRKRAINEYYKSPNFCLFCNNIIHIADHQSPWMVRRKKFCNKSCHNKYYNPKRLRKNSICTSCGKEFERYRTQSGVWSNSKNCLQCQANGNGKTIVFLAKTKKQVFNSNVSYSSARNAIAGNAQVVYKNNNGICKCLICGYDKHCDICHIKPISEFSDNSLILEINDFSNLVALCPNHHYEFDHNLMSEEYRSKIRKV